MSGTQAKPAAQLPNRKGKPRGRPRKPEAFADWTTRIDGQVERQYQKVCASTTALASPKLNTDSARAKVVEMPKNDECLLSQFYGLRKSLAELQATVSGLEIEAIEALEHGQLDLRFRKAEIVRDHSGNKRLIIDGLL